MSDGYRRVFYCCVHAPAAPADGHTTGHYSYGNAAGARWGSAIRPQKCEKCGGAIVTAGNKKDLPGRAEARMQADYHLEPLVLVPGEPATDDDTEVVYTVCTHGHASGSWVCLHNPAGAIRLVPLACFYRASWKVLRFMED